MFFEHDQVGFNYRMPNINAALGLAQLEILEKRLYAKNELFKSYKNSFHNLTDLAIIDPPVDSISNNWLINIRFNITRKKKEGAICYMENST